MSSRRVAPAIALALVLLAGALLSGRFAAAHASTRSVYNLDIDSAAYDGLAVELAATRNLRTIPTSQPPGFVVLLAGIYAVFGHSYLAVKLFFCVLLVSTAALAAWVARSRRGDLEALMAAFLILFSPLLVSYTATLQYEIPAAFLSMLITALVLAKRRPAGLATECGWAALIALTCAAAALLREVLIVLFPVALAAVMTRQWALGKAPQAMRVAGLMVMLFGAPIAAWTAIQYQHTGRLVFISEKVDLNFRIGNNPAANGTYHLQLEPISRAEWMAFHSCAPRSCCSTRST
jgi:4-amino-4-deoxy-L-arabinose transferase-like glycosyltransferase